jgi:hypothetical protein
MMLDSDEVLASLQALRKQAERQPEAGEAFLQARHEGEVLAYGVALAVVEGLTSRHPTQARPRQVRPRLSR